jgi:GT2 family glycosyltransferase
MDQHRALSIIVVSYRRADLLGRCLSNVAEHLPNHRVLVRDNRSDATPSVREVAARHPGAEWFFDERNIGFAAAVNKLASRAAPDDLLLLNPDAELTGDLSASRSALGGSRVAAVSPTVIDPAGKAKPWDVAHRRQTVLRGLVNHAGYAGRLRGTPLSDLYSAVPSSVDGYLTGCCLLVSRAAWDDLGGFDERFFVYGEEADWQRRAQRRGWELLLVDEPHVRHGGHGTTVGDILAARRGSDLLRGGHAQLLGIHHNRGPGTWFIAGLHVLDRTQRSRRTSRRRARSTDQTRIGRPAVLLTINKFDCGGAERQRVLLANELAERSWLVTVACLQSFGPLISELDLRVQLVLTPWWQPLVDLPTTDAVLITGITKTEVAFAVGWRTAGLGSPGRRRWLVTSYQKELLGPTYGTLLSRVIRGSDGVIDPSGRRLWHQTAADSYEKLVADVMSG